MKANKEIKNKNVNNKYIRIAERTIKDLYNKFKDINKNFFELSSDIGLLNEKIRKDIIR